MRKVTGNLVTGATKARAITAKPNMTARRKELKFGVSTTSTTASGVVPIKGATRYPEEPSIYFTREAWVKQCHLVSKCPMEVGWFALVDHDEKYNTFTITELVIPNQEVTAAETDIGKEDLADAAMELIEAGKDTSKMYAWFHSHVNMGVGPSAQDEYQVEDFLEDLADQPEVPAFIRGIQNKQGDLKLDVYYVQHGVAYQNVDFSVIHDDDPQWNKDIDALIASKVSARTYQQYQYGAAGGQRPAAGKSQNGNESGSTARYWGDYDARGYGGGYDIYADAYDDDFDMFGPSHGVEVDTPVATTHTDSRLKRLDINYNDRFDMEIVYTSKTMNAEVYMGYEGELLICDEQGDMYNYNDWTEIYGEIDGKTPANPVEII